MNEFTKGFNHGFFHGMFNRMFDNFNMCYWNPTPINFVANQRYFNPFEYQIPNPAQQMAIPMPQMPQIQMPIYNDSVFNYTMMNTQVDYQNFNSTLPEIKASSTFSDTFVKSKTNTGNKSITLLKNKDWSKMTDSELRSVYGNYTRDITKKYTGTAENLNKYLKGKGVLEGKGQAFIDAQNTHGISAAVLVAICMNESDKGRSNNAKNKNNVGGVRISGSNEFRTFETVDACIMEIGRFLKTGYVNNSIRPLTKLYEVNARYCPASDKTDKSGLNSYWAKNVDFYASQIENALA